MTNGQRHLLQHTTTGTGFARWQPLVYPDNGCAGLGGCLLQDVNKLGKAQVGYFPAPHAFHTVQIQGLQANDIECRAKFMRQFPMCIPAFVRYTLMRFRQPPFCLAPIVRPLLLAAQLSIQAGDLIQFGPEKLGAVVFVALMVGQECLKSKVEAADVIRAGFVHFGRFHDHRETYPQMTQVIPFDRHRLDVALNRPGKGEFVRRAVDDDTITTLVFPSCLLQCEAAVFIDLPEAWATVSWPLTSLVGEEALVRLVVPLHQFLNCLAAYHLPEGKPWRAAAQLCQMALHVVAADVLAGQTVVAPLQGNHVVPNDTSDVNTLIQPLVAAIVVEAVLESAANVHLSLTML